MFDVLIDDVKLLNLKNGKETVQQVARLLLFFLKKLPIQRREKLFMEKELICFLGSLIFIPIYSSTAVALESMQISY